jgi:hypothetical protein
MKYLIRIVFSIMLLVLACGIDVYGEISVSGDGFVNFDGTGEFILSRSPILVREIFDSNCTPSVIPGVFVICRQPLDMSLLGNDIVRAEHVRIDVSLHDLRSSLLLRFGCPTCGTTILVQEEDLVFESGVWRLSDQTAEALQELIDEHGAGSIYMLIGLNGGSVEVFSSVRAVTMDIKPGDFPNTLNLRSRGVLPIAILTTDEFDATSIDPTSLRFGATGKEAAAVRTVLTDIDNDGDTDLLVFFRIADTEIDCETLFTYISGVTVTGVSIAGTDSVTIVGCH